MRNLNKYQIPSVQSSSSVLKLGGEEVGKTKENAGGGYEVSTCFMARDVSEK